MEKTTMPLCQLPIGQIARVKELTAKDRTRRRMLDLGLISNTLVEALRKSPSGDPVAYAIRGAVIALRQDESAQILVELA